MYAYRFDKIIHGHIHSVTNAVDITWLLLYTYFTGYSLCR